MSVQTKNRLAMITRRCVALLAVVATTALLTNALVSRADDKPGQMPSEAEMAKMMEKMMKMGSPGPNHDLLKKFSGEWKATSKCYMPGQEPDVSHGETDNELMLGGRFSHQHYEGTVMMPGPNGMEKKPFEGVGVIGYDNIKKQYVSLWMDSFSTNVYMGTGQYDAAKKELTITGSGPDPMNDFKETGSKWVTRFTSADSYTFEMYSEAGPNNWMKCMEIVYTRE
jgi:hypothetical protein